MLSLARFFLQSIFTCIVLLSGSSLAAEEVIVDDAEGYSFQVPPGFVAAPELIHAAAVPKVLQALRFNDPRGKEQTLLIFILKLGGTMERKPIKAPPDFTGRMFLANWQGHVLDVAEVTEEIPELKLVTYNLQVPIKRNTIGIRLTSHANNKAELDRLLPVVLENFRGETHWDDTPLSRLLPNVRRKTLDLGAILLMVISGLGVAYCLFRQKHPIAVLVLGGIVMFFSSFWSVSNQPFSRISLAMMIIGSTAITIGVFLNVKLKKPKAPSQESLA